MEERLIPKGWFDPAELHGRNAQCSCELKDIPQGIKATDLIEVFHSGKTIMDLCKEKGIEIIIQPVTK